MLLGLENASDFLDQLPVAPHDSVGLEGSVLRVSFHVALDDGQAQLRHLLDEVHLL